MLCRFDTSTKASAPAHYIMSGSVMIDGSPAHTIFSVQDGATALYVAAQNGHVRAVQVLIVAKAQVNIQKTVRFTTWVLL